MPFLSLMLYFKTNAVDCCPSTMPALLICIFKSDDIANLWVLAKARHGNRIQKPQDFDVHDFNRLLYTKWTVFRGYEPQTVWVLGRRCLPLSAIPVMIRIDYWGNTTRKAVTLAILFLVAVFLLFSKFALNLTNFWSET